MDDKGRRLIGCRRRLNDDRNPTGDGETEITLIRSSPHAFEGLLGTLD
jgi:hypothetical protein